MLNRSSTLHATDITLTSNTLSGNSDDSDEEDTSSNLDAFSQHYNYPLPEQVSSEKLSYENKKIEWSEIGKFVFMKPKLHNVLYQEPSVKKLNINDFPLKKNLLDSILATSRTKKMSKMQIGLLNLLSDYFDLIFMKRTYENGENLRFIYVLHILNHILKSRAKIIHHNSKLAKSPDEEYRDQGFTRTVAVVLVPFRHDCHRIVSLLSEMLPDSALMNKKRFEEEYGPPPSHDRIKKKPQDYDEIFKGNINEDFKIGLKIKNLS
jgi:U3 small nucleolar RNA-associated protein 25